MAVINWTNLDSHPEEAVRFFKIMMRFEFALKDCGFINKRHDNSFEISWDKYASDMLGVEFFRKCVESNALRVLVDNPPMHQVYNAGQLSWEPASKPENIQELLGAVRRVRNNLFHGGKSRNLEDERSAALISDSILVITEVLRSDDVLCTCFNGDY